VRIGITAGAESDVARYERAVAEAGAEPVVVRPGDRAAAGDFAALVLSGGPDVDPARFGQAVPDGVRETLTIDAARDELEWQLLAGALALRIPVLGICRGVQLLNVHLGGTLHLDLAHDGVGTMSHRVKPLTELVHRVDVRGLRLASMVPTGEMVNSSHHQAVATPGRGLTVTAVSEDGVIEGVDSADGRLVGVQWHPEALTETSASARALFADLVERAAAGAAVAG
jgi:putative glutamine amidotransferase